MKKHDQTKGSQDNKILYPTVDTTLFTDFKSSQDKIYGQSPVKSPDIKTT